VTLFVRQGSDGRRSAGYLVYLAAGLVFGLALFLLHRRAGGGGAAPPGRARSPASEIAPITAAAVAIAKVELPSRPAAAGTRSLRMSPEYPSVSPEPAQRGGDPDSFDALDAALAASPGEAPGPSFPPLPPAFPPTAVRRGPVGDAAPPVREEPRAASGTQLLGYRDATADAVPAEGTGSPAVAEAGSPYFAPRGALVSVCLLTTVDTGNPAALVQFAAARRYSFNRRCQLPFGTRFLGRLSGEPVRDRVNLEADTVLYPDGLELPVNASAVEADDGGSDIRPGVAARYVPAPAWVQAAPYAADVLAGTMGLLEARGRQQLALGTGGLVATGGDLKEPLYQASGQAVQDFADRRLREVERRYAPHYLVPAGTLCWLQLAADLDLGPAHAPRRPIRLQRARVAPTGEAGVERPGPSNDARH